MGFKENVLAYKHPDTEPSLDMKKDLLDLFQSDDLNPDSYTKKAISELLSRVGELHIDDENFDDEVRKLWDDLQSLKTAIGTVDAMVIGLDAVLRKYANLNGIDLPDGMNRWFNVTDIDKAVADVNAQNAIQSSKRLVELCTTGFSDMSKISECISSEMMQVTESAESLMGPLGGLLSKRYEYSPIQPTELGINVNDIIFGSLGVAGTSADFSLIQGKSYAEIADWIDVDLSCVIDRFGDGGFQRNFWNGSFCRIFNIVIHSILECQHSTSLELLPYFKYMRNDLINTFGCQKPGGMQYTYYLLVQLVVGCICAKIEDESFHQISNDTKMFCGIFSHELSQEEVWCKMCDPLSGGIGINIPEALRKWMNKLGSGEGKVAYPKDTLGKIIGWIESIPGGSTSLLIPCSGEGSTCHANISNPCTTDRNTVEDGSLVNRLQVEQFSKERLEELVRESVRNMIQENHQVIMGRLVHGSSDEQYQTATCEQVEFQKLKWLSSPEESYYKRMVDRDCNMQTMVAESKDVDRPLLYQNLIAQMSRCGNKNQS